MPPHTINSVLEAAAKRAIQELESTYAARDAIRSALDGYVAAVEAGIAEQLATKLGISGGERPVVAHAAAALLRALERLPELVSPTQAPVPMAAVPEKDVDAEALWVEVRALGDMTELSDDQFRWIAEDLSGRARLIQERLGDRGRDAPESRVVRKLTWIASQRGLRDIHGLKRRDTGNWSEQVKRAQRERRRFESPHPQAPTKARDQQGRAATAPEPQLVLEGLAALGRPIVIVGGEMDPQKLERLRRRASVELEWIGIDDVSPLEGRIRRGGVGALVVLQALVSHSQIDPVMRSARETGVPLEYGGKAGLASIEAALVELNARLARAAA
jgi:hypothetical protein